jgi:hypothetical protein
MTRKQLADIITKEIDNNLMDYERHNFLRVHLSKHEGKPISKRILNGLDGWMLDSRYGMCHLVNSDKKSHLIAYDTNSIISLENFDKFDAAYGSAAKERADQLKDLYLNRFDELLETYNEIEKANNKLKNAIKNAGTRNLLSYHNPAYYAIVNKIGIGTDTMNQYKS